MLHWICPECGRECEPVERDCPDCYPEAAAAAATLVTAGSAHSSATTAVVSIPQIIAARTGIVLPPPLPPPLPVPSFLLPDPEPVPEPLPAVAEAPDPVPAGLTALSISMEAQAVGKQPPSIAAVLEPLFQAGQDAPVAGLPWESGVEPQPVAGMREPATLELPVFRQYRAFRPSTTPLSYANGANALAFDAIAYQEEEAHLTEPAGLAQSASGLELASDPALLEVLEREAAASRTEELWQAFDIHAARVPAPVSFVTPAGPLPPAAIAFHGELAYTPEPEVCTRPNLKKLRQSAGIAEDINLLAKVATYEAHQRTVRALDEAASQLGPLLYRRFRPIPRTIRLVPCTPLLRFWPWATVDPSVPAHSLPDSFGFEPEVLEAVQAWEVEQQHIAAQLEAESSAKQEALSEDEPEVPQPSEESLLMGPEVPTMYHLAIPVIPPPQQQQPLAEHIDQENKFSETMRFAVPVVPPPPQQQQHQPEPEPEPEPVVALEPEPEPALALEPEVVTSTEVIRLTNAIVLANRDHGQDPANDTGEHVLTPIIEAPVPPMAKQVKLPWYGLSPMAVKPAPRSLEIPPVFSIADAYIPPRSTKVSRPIPSPLLHSRNAAVSRPPSWLVTAAVAILIPITAIGIVNYWILPAQRASAATEAVEAAAPPTGAQQEAPAAANWRKQLQLTGIRIQDSKVRFVLINHAKTDAPAMSLLVHLRAVNSKAADPSIASFQIRLSPLAPGEARDLTSGIDLIPPVRNVDWSDIRADIQTAKLL